MFRRTTIVSPLILALFVTAGLQSVWGIVLGIGYKTVSRALEDYPGQLRVDPRGRIVLEYQLQDKLEYRTTDGRPVDVPEFPYWLGGAPLAAPLSDRHGERQLPWSERLTWVYVPTRPSASWYLVHSATSDGAGYFVGYNDLSNATIGYIGRSGFRAVEPPAGEWFAMAGPAGRHSALRAWYATAVQQASGDPATTDAIGGQGIVYLISDGSVWRIDLMGRKAEMLFESPDAASVIKSPRVAELPPEEAPEDWQGGPYYAFSDAGLLVRTPTEVIGIDLDGRRRTSWPIPAKLRGTDCTWYELADGGALAMALRWDGDLYWGEFHWIDSAGNVTREEAVYYTPHPPASQPYWMYAALTPQVLVASLINLVVLPDSSVNNGSQPDFHTAFAQALADGWVALLAVYVLSALLAGLAYRRQTRFALPEAGAWAVFVFLFGAPGWLAYRWHRRWPVLEACSECHRPAPRDRESCAACGSVFAPPPLTGTEIFA